MRLDKAQIASATERSSTDALIMKYQQKRKFAISDLSLANWEQRARDLKIEDNAFINGKYTAAVSNATFECISPVDGRLLAHVASCDVADAQRAVENARATFNSGVWSRLTQAKRKVTMIRFAGLLKQHAEELALLETLDMGKPISDSL